MTAPPEKTTLNYVTPTYGPSGGGTIVTLSGTKLQEVTGVLFGETQAINVIVADENRVICVAPPGPADTAVHVTAEHESGPLTLANAYTYTSAPRGR